MIIYLTKQTVDRYKIKMPNELTNETVRELAQNVIEKEAGLEVFEWGAKLFYFDRRKCIQLVNFATKMTIFLFDVKVDDVENIGTMLINYLFEIYDDNPEVQKLIEKYAKESPIVCFEKLKNRSIISTLNSTQRTFAIDGDRFYDFIENNVLKTVEINKKVNFHWVFTTKIGKKTDYFFSADKFEEVLKNRYSNHLRIVK